MRSNLFKLSAIAATILTSFGANAALYNVYHYEPVVDDSAKTFGVAIQPSSADCWSSLSDNPLAIDCSTTHTTDQQIAFEEQRYNQGFDYRDEVPFRISDGYDFLEENQDGFDRYCDTYLRYNETACINWASEQFSHGYKKEADGDFSALSFIEATQTLSGKPNVVINSFSSTSDVLGTYHGGSLSNRSVAFDTSRSPTIELDSGSYTQSKVWAKTSSYLVGSVSKSSSGSYPDYESKAAIWKVSDGSLTDINNEAGTNGRHVQSGNARDISECKALSDPLNAITLECVENAVYAVGYNSNDHAERNPIATIYTIDDASGSGYSPTVTRRFHEFDNDDYSNSLLTSVNQNGYAIGEAKLNKELSRSYANRLFHTTVNGGAVVFFEGSIFFSGANGKAGAINNYNEVVGQIDYEKHAEIGGGPRAKRAFVTTIDSPSSSTRPLKGQSRYLDDLTMGSNAGALATNNQYRIIDATDINDAGVISGTAYFCSSGYDSESINSTCNGGTPGVEKIVAVKLVPIQGATSSDIQTRPVDVTKIDRQGGSLGWLALSLLALLGFRRKQ